MNTIPINTISEIKYLRKRGFSVPEISRKLDLSKSTVFRYIRGAPISPLYYKRWLNRRNASKIISERNWATAYQMAEKRISKITDKDLILVATCLYWAEGAKKDFTFSNTDAEMVKIFVHILKRVFGVENQDLKISLRIYEDLNKKVCLKHWSKITGIELNQNTSIDILKGAKRGKLQYGMCRIRVKKGGLLLKEFSAIIDRIISLAAAPRSSMDRTGIS